MWKRYPTGDKPTHTSMAVEGNALVGLLPSQPPAGKVTNYLLL